MTQTLLNWHFNGIQQLILLVSWRWTFFKARRVPLSQRAHSALLKTTDSEVTSLHSTKLYTMYMHDCSAKPFFYSLLDRIPWYVAHPRMIFAKQSLLSFRRIRRTFLQRSLLMVSKELQISMGSLVSNQAPGKSIISVPRYVTWRLRVVILSVKS